MDRQDIPRRGDYVVYRNPRKFLGGDANHTNYYYVDGWQFSQVVLVDLRTGGRLCGDPRWMRVVDPADFIADIDVSLGGGGHLPPAPGQDAELPSPALRALTV